MADAPQRTGKRKMPTPEEIVNSKHCAIFVSIKNKADGPEVILPFCWADSHEDMTRKLVALKAEKDCYVASGGTSIEGLSSRYFVADCKGERKGWVQELDSDGNVHAMKPDWNDKHEIVDVDDLIYTSPAKRRLRAFSTACGNASMSFMARLESVDQQIKFWEKVNTDISNDTLAVLNSIYTDGEYRKRLTEKDILADSSEEGEQDSEDDYKPRGSDVDD